MSPTTRLQWTSRHAQEVSLSTFRLPIVRIKLYNRPLRVDAEQGQSIERPTSSRSLKLNVKKDW